MEKAKERLAEKREILVICRTTAGMMYLGILLNRIWYKPTLVKTVDEALHQARSGSFTLIALDGDLPEDERRTAISILKTEPTVKNLPLVIFITTENLTSYESLVAQGCAAVVTKPLDLSLVYGVLARLSGQPRQTPRLPVRMQVEIEEQKPEKELTCVNISEGGVYLRTLAPLPERALLHLKFILPRDTEEIKVIGEVVRTAPLGAQLDAEPGMGLRFVDISDDALKQIRNFVQWETLGDLEWEANF